MTMSSPGSGSEMRRKRQEREVAAFALCSAVAEIRMRAELTLKPGRAFTTLKELD